MYPPFCQISHRNRAALLLAFISMSATLSSNSVYTEPKCEFFHHEYEIIISNNFKDIGFVHSQTFQGFWFCAFTNISNQNDTIWRFHINYEEQMSGEWIYKIFWASPPPHYSTPHHTYPSDWNSIGQPAEWYQLLNKPCQINQPNWINRLRALFNTLWNCVQYWCGYCQSLGNLASGLIFFLYTPVWIKAVAFVSTFGQCLVLFALHSEYNLNWQFWSHRGGVKYIGYWNTTFLPQNC